VTASPAFAVEALPKIGRCVKVAPGAEFASKNCVTRATNGKGTYQWLEGAEKKKYKAEMEGLTPGGPVDLQTANPAHLIRCQVGIVEEGEYTGGKTEKQTLILVGCGLPATKQPCQTNPVPMKEGEIEFKAEGSLGFITGGEKPVAGWDLKGSVTLTCGTPTEVGKLITLDTIEGSVIAPVVKINTAVIEMTERYKAVSGKQIPEKFEGEPTDVPTSKIISGASLATEQTGLIGGELIENEEPLEIKAKCVERLAPCK
jgi:hypothetical protein